MFVLLLVLNAFVTIAMIGCILLQRSEGGALGIGGGGLPTRSAPEPLARATAILAAIFITLSLLLTIVAQQQAGPRSLIDDIDSTPVSEAPADPLLPTTAPALPQIPSEQ